VQSLRSRRRSLILRIAETIAAIEELESGGGKSFDSVEEPMAELKCSGRLSSSFFDGSRFLETFHGGSPLLLQSNEKTDSDSRGLVADRRQRVSRKLSSPLQRARLRARYHSSSGLAGLRRYGSRNTETVPTMNVMLPLPDSAPKDLEGPAKMLIGDGDVLMSEPVSSEDTNWNLIPLTSAADPDS
jgi:hypothetical protein